MRTSARRRFPYAPGPLGWVGAAFLVLAGLCQLAAGFLLTGLVMTGNGGFVSPMIGIFVFSFVLLGVTMLTWRGRMEASGHSSTQFSDP